MASASLGGSLPQGHVGCGRLNMGEQTKSTEIDANSTSNLLDILPTEIWVVIVGGVIAALGWFGKTAWDNYQKSRLPFKEDKNRYQETLSNLNADSFYYFQDPMYNCVYKRHLDGIDNSFHFLDKYRKAPYLNNDMSHKEAHLKISLEKLTMTLNAKFFPCRGNSEVFTMYWDSFDEWDNDQQKSAAIIQDEIHVAANELVKSFEEFRDAGNRIFAARLVEAP